MGSNSVYLDGSVWISCANFSNILLSNKGFMADLQTDLLFKGGRLGRELLIRLSVI